MKSSSCLDISVRKFEDEEDQEDISTIVECELTVQSDLLKDKNIIISTDFLSDSLCLRQQQQQGNDNEKDNNDNARISRVRPSIWCKLPFSKHNTNNSLYPLPIRCDDCDDKFFMFRDSELKFSAHGKCNIPIVFKMHEEIPLDAELVLRIEIATNEDIILKGQTIVLFKKTEESEHSLFPEKEKEKAAQELFQTAAFQLQVVMSSIEARPSQSPQLKSLKRKAELVLADISKHIPERRVVIRKC